MKYSRSMKNAMRVVVAGALSVSASAYAALPTAAASAVNGIQTDGQAIFDLVFPVVAAFVALTVVIKLFKRFSNKV